MIDKIQLRALISNVLQKHMGDYDSVSVDLLMGIAAHESKLGTYLYQIKGNAKGIFQIEPNTERDVWDNYLRYRSDIRLKLQKETGVFGYDSGFNLEGNLIYQICLARVMLKRFRDPLPKYGDIEGYAEYWKKHWNTHKGRGTVEQFIKNYNELVK